MKKNILLILILALSCKKHSETDKVLYNRNALTEKQKKVENHIHNLDERNVFSTKEDMRVIDSNSTSIDLSNKNLKKIPDLSKYDKIYSIDLSNNKIENLDLDKLPEGLRKINISHNKLIGNLRIEKNKCKKIEELNLSFNNLSSINISCPILKLDLSTNDIRKINLNTTKLKYLDVSNNKNLSNIVDFDPKSIKTLKQEGILVDSALIFSLSKISPLN